MTVQQRPKSKIHLPTAPLGTIRLDPSSPYAIVVPSHTTPGVEYRVAGDRCTCQAGQRNIPCKHLRDARDWQRAQVTALARRLSAARTGRRCRHCGALMPATVTPAGEACYECPGCGWTVAAAVASYVFE